MKYTSKTQKTGCPYQIKKIRYFELCTDRPLPPPSPPGERYHFEAEHGVAVSTCCQASVADGIYSPAQDGTAAS